MNKGMSLDVKVLEPDLLPLTEKFNSGNTYIDKFLKNGDYSLDSSVGKTYVFLSKKGTEIIGFYNLSVGSVDSIEEVGTRKARIRMGGSININYFALDEKYHRQVQYTLPDCSKIYLSGLLLDECFQRIEMITEHHIGAAFVTLSSIKEGYHLYTRNGFEELEDGMYFTMERSDHECIQLYRWIHEEL